MEISREYIRLFEAALSAAGRAYAPYSHFRVGAALLLEDGEIITGVNVENRSYGLTNCAERTAFYTAVAAGKTEFKALAVAAPDADYPVSPCGACRQVITEFMPPEALIIFGSSKDNIVLTGVKDIFPLDALHELKTR